MSQSASLPSKRCNKCGLDKPLGDYYRDYRYPERRKAICKTCVLAKNAKWQAANRAQASGIRRRSDAKERRELRAQVLAHYGQVCACCGSTYRLEVDHVNGDGRAHRTALFGSSRVAGVRFWRWLIAQGFPPGYQTLCKRCNSSKWTGPACRMHSGGGQVVTIRLRLLRWMKAYSL